jgi:2-phospho-L-lactate/phosphoenolpyruvate guanylyltransferase
MLEADAGLWAVIVARVGNGAKSRLAGVLDPAQRRRLALAMLGDVVAVCRESAGLLEGVVAVVDEPAARCVAQRAGAVVVDDPTPADMNIAAARGILKALQFSARTVIVLPGDVPLISSHDLSALINAAAHERRAVIIGASRDGLGTNALLLRPPRVIDPAFGPPSVERHVRAGRVAGAVTRVESKLGLSLDVDTPADLAALADAPVGPRTAALFGGLLRSAATAPAAGSAPIRSATRSLRW